MGGLSIELNDLSDEILLIIFQKLNNIFLLNSLIGVNKHLSRLVCDSIFTSHLTLMNRSSDGSILKLPRLMIDRFCSEILPRIHHKIKWLDLELSSMKRILLVTNYPNL